jgi:cytochrome c-type biogenesis protein CcsB
VSVVLAAAATVIYLVAGVLYFTFVFTQRRGLHRAGQAVLWLAWAGHTAALVVWWLTQRQVPGLDFNSSLSVAAWALTGLYLLLSLRLPVMVLGALVAPLSAVMIVASALLPAHPTKIAPGLKLAWLLGHVLTAILGYAAFGLCFLAAVLYLVQEWHIKTKRLGPIFRRLPPLEALDHLGHTCLIIGFPLLTLAMITGAVYANYAAAGLWRWDPLVAATVIIWLLYAILLHGRLMAGWSGRRAAVLAVAAFGLLLISYLVLVFLAPGYHAAAPGGAGG